MFLHFVKNKNVIKRRRKKEGGKQKKKIKGFLIELNSPRHLHRHHSLYHTVDVVVEGETYEVVTWHAGAMRQQIFYGGIGRAQRVVEPEAGRKCVRGVQRR